MPFASLSSLSLHMPLRVLVVSVGAPHSLTLAGLVQPLQLAAAQVGAAQLQIEVIAPQAVMPAAHLTLLVADTEASAATPEQIRHWINGMRQSPCWGAVGTAVLWLARAGALDGLRTALPWALYADAGEAAERAILTPNLFELDGNRLTCCGGTASVDFSLTLIAALFGPDLQSHIKELLCIDRVRGPEERQRLALQARFGASQPKLSEAVTLMEANLEEPLGTDDIAALVGLSRRQLDRLFKQHLATVPSRYYLELRLQRARQLLLESHHSIVQVGLMCGFSSGSHFSTAYGTLFGITPREQRQRKLKPASL